MKTSKYATQVAQLFLQSGVVTVDCKNLITRTHGKVAPIDINLKKLFEDPLSRIQFRKIILEFIDDLKINSWSHIVAIGQSGMYPASCIADYLNLSLFAKKDNVNWYKTNNDLVIVDIISQGKTCKNIHADIFTCFSYNFYHRENIFVLCDFNTLINTALENNFINAQDANSLLAWQKNPKCWVQNYLAMKLL